MTQFVISSLQGMQYEWIAEAEHREEVKYVDGVNYYLALWPQWKQIGLAFSYLGTLPPLYQGKYSIGNYTTALGLGFCLLNLAAAQYKHNYFKPPFPFIAKSLNFIAGHSGEISHGIIIITSIAKVILGQYVTAVSQLTLLFINHLEKNNLLSKKVQTVVKIYLPTVTILSGIILGTPFIQFVCLLHLVHMIVPKMLLNLKKKVGNSLDEKLCQSLRSGKAYYPSLNELEVENLPNKDPKFSAEEIIHFDENQRLLVDPLHVKRASKITLSNEIEFKEGDVTPFKLLLDLFDNIPWSENIKSFDVLEKMVVGDERWQDQKKDWDEETLSVEQNKEKDPKKWKNCLVAWTRKQLETFIEKVSLKQRPSGNLIGFREKQIQCLQVIDYLRNTAIDPVQLEDILLTFAIVGGGYCIDGIEDAIEINYDRILCAKLCENTDFRTRIDERLLKHRREAFISTMMKLNDSPLIPRPLKLNDRHNKNFFMQMFGHGLGLRVQDFQIREPTSEFITWAVSLFFPYRLGFWQNAYEIEGKLDEDFVEGESELSFAEAMKLVGFFHSLLETVKETFKNVYNEETILSLIEDLYTRKVITPQDILEWWQQYLLLKNFETDSVKLTDLILDSEKGVILPNGLNRRYLKIMCVELGYLRKPEKPSDF